MEKASTFTETRINYATIGFGNKCEALFALLLLGVQRKAVSHREATFRLSSLIQMENPETNKAVP